MPSTDPEYNKKYYLRNKERLLKRKRAYYVAHREQALEYQHEWNRLNRPPKHPTQRVAPKRTKTVSGKVRVVLPVKYKRPRNNPPVSGEASLPTGEHGGALPDVPRVDSSPGSDEDGNDIE